MVWILGKSKVINEKLLIRSPILPRHIVNAINGACEVAEVENRASGAVVAAKGEIVAGIFRELLLRLNRAFDFNRESAFPVGDGVHLEACLVAVIGQVGLLALVQAVFPQLAEGESFHYGTFVRVQNQLLSRLNPQQMAK